MFAPRPWRMVRERHAKELRSLIPVSNSDVTGQALGLLSVVTWFLLACNTNPILTVVTAVNNPPMRFTDRKVEYPFSG